MPKVALARGHSFCQGRVGVSPNRAGVDRLRIGFFTEVYRPVVNGVVESVEGLAAGLRARAHEVYCFAPRMPGATDVDPIVRMPSLPLPANTPYRLTLPLVSRRNVNNIIKRLSLVHVHSLFVTGWTGLRYARRYGLPIVYTYHTQLEAYAHYVPFEPNATRFAATQLTRTFGNLVDAVVVPTPAMAAHLRRSGVESRIEVVPSGIDVGRFGAGRRSLPLRASLGVGAEQQLLLFVSRLAREKNVDVLLEALADVADPRLRLVIAGDGPARAELEELARGLGVADAVRFLGAVPRDRLPDLYASADAFVFPSTSETQGLVLAEALAAGARVIAAECPPNRDVIGDAGILVGGDRAGFAAALRRHEGVVNDALVRRSKRAAARFALSHQVDRILDLYASLLSPGAEAPALDGSNIRSLY
jgi:1,2-diacylglycerol 3-alpha-glucosyltransferase